MQSLDGPRGGQTPALASSRGLWIEMESENMQAKWVVCSWGIDSKPIPATCFKAQDGTHGPCCLQALAELMSQRQETWRALWPISGEVQLWAWTSQGHYGKFTSMFFSIKLYAKGVHPVHSQLTGDAPMPSTRGPERSRSVPLGRCRGLQGREVQSQVLRANLVAD